jgi:hypothetical protein
VFDRVREASAIAFFVATFCEQAQLKLAADHEEHVRWAVRAVAEKLAVAVRNQYESP